MIAATEDALAAKRLLKGALSEKLVMEARWARLELFNLCAFIEPSDHDRSKAQPGQFPDDSHWQQVADILFDIGGAETWPAKEALETWLRGTVLPLLKWAAYGEQFVTAIGPGQGLSCLNARAGGCRNGFFEDGRPPGSPSSLKVEDVDSDRASAAEQARDYLIAPEHAFEGVGHEILLEEGTGWQPAVLQDGCWIGADGEACVREGRPVLIRACQESVRVAVDFIAFLRTHYQEEGASPEAVERTCGQSAAVLADVVVCGRPVGESPGPAAASRSRIAAALNRDSERNVA